MVVVLNFSLFLVICFQVKVGIPHHHLIRRQKTSFGPFHYNNHKDIQLCKCRHCNYYWHRFYLNRCRLNIVVQVAIGVAFQVTHLYAVGIRFAIWVISGVISGVVNLYRFQTR